MTAFPGVGDDNRQSGDGADDDGVQKNAQHGNDALLLGTVCLGSCMGDR